MESLLLHVPTCWISGPVQILCHLVGSPVGYNWVFTVGTTTGCPAAAPAPSFYTYHVAKLTPTVLNKWWSSPFWVLTVSEKCKSCATVEMSCDICVLVCAFCMHLMIATREYWASHDCTYAATFNWLLYVMRLRNTLACGWHVDCTCSVLSTPTPIDNDVEHPGAIALWLWPTGHCITLHRISLDSHPEVSMAQRHIPPKMYVPGWVVVYSPICNWFLVGEWSHRNSLWIRDSHPSTVTLGRNWSTLEQLGLKWLQYKVTRHVRVFSLCYQFHLSLPITGTVRSPDV